MSLVKKRGLNFCLKKGVSDEKVSFHVNDVRVQFIGHFY